MSEVIKSIVKFRANGKKRVVAVVHNMPETPGLSFDDAFNNWVHRTTEHTSESFVAYVRSKHTGCMIMTVDKFNTLNSK